MIAFLVKKCNLIFGFSCKCKMKLFFFFHSANICNMILWVFFYGVKMCNNLLFCQKRNVFMTRMLCTFVFLANVILHSCMRTRCYLKRYFKKNYCKRLLWLFYLKNTYDILFFVADVCQHTFLLTANVEVIFILFSFQRPSLLLKCECVTTAVECYFVDNLNSNSKSICVLNSYKSV